MRRDILQIAKLLLAVVATSVGVALTYVVFEHLVTHLVPSIWDDVFWTDTVRLFVLPASVLLSLLYFWAQHHFDPQSEKHEEHALGDVPDATPKNFVKILSIGLLSMLAGATLGVESILVPACIILGMYVAGKLVPSPRMKKALGAVGFIALFTAFFHSFIMGMLALYLLKQSQGLKLQLKTIVLAAIASGTTMFALGVLPGGGEHYLSLPNQKVELTLGTVTIALFLVAAGYATTYLIRYAHDFSVALKNHIPKDNWLKHGIVAGTGIAALYLLGGSLVQFTGNLSIAPMLHRAPELGTIGLLWLVLVKSVAIGWSKALGYRGGLIFPTVFVASAFVDIALLHTQGVNFHFGLILVMVGAFIANRKLRVLV
ncbi:hypothetical protein KDA14_02635, partial [Candidatus Saccharibacteria bacterium]|nr:hypothetical protein [Candidatus Saccharibacteria bacterium]